MNILLVSNDEQFVNILSFAISLKGYGVLIARSASESISLIRNKMEMVNVVAVDYLQDNSTNGLELTSEISTLIPTIPIFLLAPFKDEILLAEAKRSGCRDVILKPLVIDELLKKLPSNES